MKNIIICCALFTVIIAVAGSLAPRPAQAVVGVEPVTLLGGTPTTEPSTSTPPPTPSSTPPAPMPTPPMPTPLSTIAPSGPPPTPPKKNTPMQIAIITLIPIRTTPSPTAPSEESPPEELPTPPGRRVAAGILPTPPEIAPVTCEGRFIAYDLEHITTLASDVIGWADALGAGVAVNDLDNDGDLDIVLGGGEGPDTIQWNEGALTFRAMELGNGQTRAVHIVDVDSDGWSDIVFTRWDGAIDYWHNEGQSAEEDGQLTSIEQFTEQSLTGVTGPAFGLDWADLDGDGDLDLVTGAYDATLADGTTELTAETTADSSGVTYFERDGATFVPTILSTQPLVQALAFVDLDGDGQPEIVAGNDGGAPDQVWVREDGEWVEKTPFEITSVGPRSFTWGDLNNDGVKELLSTDRLSYANDRQSTAAWEPILDLLEELALNEDTQVLANTLQAFSEPDFYFEEAALWGVEATGWSWSSQFGDFDNDGYLDLYVVNGMLESELFAHLRNGELVEENQVLRNIGGRIFAPVPEWELGSRRGGRGMVIADLDNDGDLDIVVNNLRSRAQYFENRLCRGDFLEVDLQWLASQNSRGIGAELVLTTETTTYYRTVRAASGFLSGEPSRVHFGFPTGTQLQTLTVRWPDGEITEVDQVEPNQIITVDRDQ